MRKISGPKIWSCKFFEKSHVCSRVAHDDNMGHNDYDPVDDDFINNRDDADNYEASDDDDDPSIVCDI